MGGVVEAAITEKLESTFKPLHLAVVNESSAHNVPSGSETHFKVVVVSSTFAGTPKLERHRAVNSVLEMELKGGVHALSIVTKTPEEWAKSGGAVPESPPCLGGSRR
jgi:stress-induced morphogen